MFLRFGRERSPQIIGMQPGPITGDLDSWEQAPNNCPECGQPYCTSCGSCHTAGCRFIRVVCADAQDRIMRNRD
ncbi:hypothetical protein KDH_31760 [Dictyobacter sp. S3.2.2.5]|uniref:Uncharacterized protein n=1 Tax=Dictyobacter halimunensis TaxID=3026934 RepID=A0ABQ6FV72_9CHLR|nr:hypothetical protein KDH_31760 [Dictyobacter sp. S3.2.2.5]